MDIDTSVIIEVFTVFVAVGVISAFVGNIMAFPENRRAERFWYASPIIFWMIHLIIFYIVVIAKNYNVPDPQPTVFLRTWSAVVRFHGVSSLLMKEILVFYRQRWKDNIRNGGLNHNHGS